MSIEEFADRFEMGVELVKRRHKLEAWDWDLKVKEARGPWVEFSDGSVCHTFLMQFNPAQEVAYIKHRKEVYKPIKWRLKGVS